MKLLKTIRNLLHDASSTVQTFLHFEKKRLGLYALAVAIVVAFILGRLSA